MSWKAASSFTAVLAMLAAPSIGAVATTSFSAAREGANPEALKITEADGGHVIAVKLAGLGKDTKVHRARLRAQRGRLKDRRDLLVAIEVYAGRRAAGRPLALAAPDYVAFDATEAVRKAVAAGGLLELLVKAFPGWRQEATRLEVTYEGEPPPAPPAVTALKAFHRAGQTFLTWKEVDPPVQAEELTFGEYEKARAGSA